MCPVCLATAAVIAGSATGTGGLTALAATILWKRKPANKIPHITEQKEEHDGHDFDRGTTSEDRIAR
jgi:hypothetical protein